MSTPEVIALQSQIINLEKRLRALEAAAGQPGESLSANYLTISNSGIVSATFNGLLVGSLRIPEGFASFAPNNAVAWFDGSNNLREFVHGYLLGGNTHELDVASQADANNNAIVTMTSTVGGGPTGIGVQLIDGGVGLGATILDGGGNSSFLFGQGNLAKRHMVGFGTAGPFTVTANTVFSFAHGFSTTPVFAMAIALGFIGQVSMQAADATNINLSVNVALAGNFLYYIAST